MRETLPSAHDWEVIDGGLSRALPSLAVLGEVRRISGCSLGDELRKPLRDAERRIDLLLAGGYGPVAGAQREQLRAAVEATEFLSALVSLVGLAEGGERGDEEEEFDLRFPLWDVADEHGARVREKRMALDLRLPATPLAARGGREWTRTLLRFTLREHLLSSAPGGRLEIGAGREGEEIVVRFERRGPLPGRNRTPQRAGRALALALLERRHGRLEVRDGGAVWVLGFRAVVD